MDWVVLNWEQLLSLSWESSFMLFEDSAINSLFLEWQEITDYNMNQRITYMLNWLLNLSVR